MNGNGLDFEEVLSKVSIVSVVSEYVQLKKKGQNHWGLCPFHNDRNPSFSVNEQKGIYKCFSCGKGGNVITFVAEAEKISFYDAAYLLADRYGIKYEKKSGGANEEYKKLREDIYSVNTNAARFFYAQLGKSQEAQNYLKSRNLSPEVAGHFGIGYSPNEWDALFSYFKERGIGPELLLKAGLITKNDNGGYYDRFRGRLMFPIFDSMGKVIGFGGRTLEKDAKTAKYINSQETPVYVKGEHLYGLNFAKKSGEKRVIVVEGYMDCIALQKSGITNAVAALGTALTQNQARLLKKHFTEVISAFDADEAGKTATLRSLDILQAEGLSVKVFRLTGAKDADEYLNSHTKDEFLNQLDKAYTLVEYKIMLAAEENPEGTNTAMIGFLKAAKKVLSSLPETDRQVYSGWITRTYGGRYGFTESMLTVENVAMKEPTKKVVKNFVRKENTENDGEPSGEELPKTDQKRDMLEKQFVAICCENPALLSKYSQEIREDNFSIESTRRFWNKALELQKKHELKGFTSLCDGGADDSEIAKVMMEYNVNPAKASEAAAEALNKIKLETISGKLDEINRQLKDCDDGEKIQLVKKMQELLKEKKLLQKK